MTLRSDRRLFSFSVDVDWIPGSEIGLSRLYEFCDEEGLPTTFFVAGQFARAYPELLRRAPVLGHELGTHGWEHGQLNADSEENFLTASEAQQRRWLEDSTVAVEDASGVRPVTFRAPNVQISETTFRILDSLGYWVDSSVPARRLSFSYGRLNSSRYFAAPLRPYIPSREHLAKPGAGTILEVPPSAVGLPLNMSFLRMFGPTVTSLGVRVVEASTNVLVFYVHPAEFTEPERQTIPADNPARHREGLGPHNFAPLRQLVRWIKARGYEPMTLSNIAHALGHRHRT